MGNSIVQLLVHDDLACISALQIERVRCLVQESDRACSSEHADPTSAFSLTRDDLHSLLTQHFPELGDTNIHPDDCLPLFRLKSKKKPCAPAQSSPNLSAAFKRNGYYALLIQRHFRGYVHRKRARLIRKYNKDEAQRRYAYFCDATGEKRIESIFGLLKRNGSTVNPFHGKDSVDKLDTLLSLAFLCSGTFLEKFRCVFGFFSMEDSNRLTKEELALFFLASCKSLSNIYDCGKIRIGTRAAEKLVDNVLQAKGKGGSCCSYHELLHWCTVCPLASKWAAKIAQDCQFYRFQIGMDIHTVIVGDFPENGAEQGVECHSSIGVFPVFPCTKVISAQPAAACANTFAISPNMTTKSGNSAIQLRKITHDHKVEASSGAVSVAPPPVFFEKIDRDVKLGTSLRIRYRVVQESSMAERKRDFFGIFEAGSPVGCTGYYSYAHPHIFTEGVSEVSFPSCGLPPPNARFVILESGTSVWISGNGAALFDNLITPALEDLNENTFVLARCCDKWLGARVLRLQDTQNGIQVEFEDELLAECKIKCCSPSSLRLIQSDSFESNNPACQQDGAHVLVRTERAYQEGTVVNTGKFEIRYCAYVGTLGGVSHVQLSSSNLFAIHDYDVEFLEVQGGELGQYVCMKVRLGSALVPGADGRIVICKPERQHSDPSPIECDKCIVDCKMREQQAENGLVSLRFDMYYGPFTTGEYEARFIDACGKTTSKSQTFTVTPIAKFRDESRVERGKYLVCYFDISNEHWSPHDYVELWRIDPKGDQAPRKVLWRYVNHCRRTNRMFSLETKKMQLGYYEWRYFGAQHNTYICKSKPIEIFEIVVVLTEEQIQEKNASKLQGIIRMKIARKRYIQVIEESRRKKQEEHVRMDRIKKEYAKVARSNAKRNQMLLSKRDKRKEQNLKEIIDEQENAEREKEAKLSELREYETVKIAQIQEEAREDRERNMSDAKRSAEQLRQSIKKRAQTYREPLKRVPLYPLKIGAVASELNDVGQFIRRHGMMYEDKSFGAEKESLSGTTDFRDTTLEIGDIVWMRPQEMSGRGKHAPFIERVSWTTIRASEFVRASAQNLFHCISLMATYPHLLERTLDITYAEWGLYGVSLFFEGDWKVIIVDDRIPCRIAENGTSRPAFCRGVLSSDERGGRVTELWPMLLEKALAKLSGSYARLCADSVELTSLINYCTGGISSTYKLEKVINMESDDTSTASESSSESSSDGSEEDDAPFTIDDDAEEHPHKDLIAWLRAFSHRHDVVARRGAIGRRLSAPGEIGKKPLAIVTAIREEEEETGVGSSVDAPGVIITPQDGYKPKSVSRWSVHVVEVLTLHISEIYDSSDSSDESSSEEEKKDENVSKSRPNRSNASKTLKRKLTPLKTPARLVQRRSSSKARRSQKAPVEQKKSDAKPLGMPSAVTLIRLKTFGPIPANVAGKWSKESPFWTEEVKQAAGYDEIGDGTFWLSLQEFVDYFTFWGFVYRPKVVVDELQCCRKEPGWYVYESQDLSWVAHHSSAGINDSLIHRNPSCKLSARHYDFVILELEHMDEMRMAGKPPVCSFSASTDPGFNNAESELFSLTLENVRKKAAVIHAKDLPIGSPIYVRACLLHTGVESACTLRALCMRSSMFYNRNAPKLAKVDAKSRQPNPELAIVPSNQTLLRGDMRAALRKVAWQHACLTCETVVPKRSGELFSWRGLSWHRTVDCFKCSACGISFDLCAPNSDERCVMGPRTPPLCTVVYDDASMTHGGYCESCWIRLYGQKCSKCGAKMNMAAECKPCILKARIEAAPKCFMCKGPMCYIEGIYTGKVIDCNGGNVIHEECLQSYTEFVSPKCMMCKGPLCAVPEKFSGRKKRTEYGKIHAECWDSFRIALKKNSMKFKKKKR